MIEKVDLYLTPDEMHELTGTPIFRLQVRALKSGGWPFFVNAKGRPKVLREYHDARMNGQTPSACVAAMEEPKWSVL
jgi:hypothetical protein